MTDLQSGSVTFLFTDVEGSTRLWEAQPRAMSVALARHDALLHAAIESAGGTVFKTVGDAFCAAFPVPEAAIEAAKSSIESAAEPSSSPVSWAMAAMGACGADKPLPENDNQGACESQTGRGLVGQRAVG